MLGQHLLSLHKVHIHTSLQHVAPLHESGDLPNYGQPNLGNDHMKGITQLGPVQPCRTVGDVSLIHTVLGHSSSAQHCTTTLQVMLPMRHQSGRRLRMPE